MEPVPDASDIEAVNSLWCLNSLPNKFREFLFKFYNNRLGLNVRTSHFGGETRYCTFCQIANNPSTDETFLHLFYNCDAVRLIHDQIGRDVLGLSIKTKKNWFGFPTGLMNNIFYALFFLSIQYFIWNSKLNHRLPSASFCLRESIQLLDKLSRLSPRIFNYKDNYDCVLSRSWDRLQARRW